MQQNRYRCFKKTAVDEFVKIKAVYKLDMNSEFEFATCNRKLSVVLKGEAARGEMKGGLDTGFEFNLGVAMCNRNLGLS
jgi:hypothetical protein